MNTKKEALKELSDLYKEIKESPKLLTGAELEKFKLRLQIIEIALTKAPQTI